MRSRKVSPGLTVTRTTSQSDSTRVPPVTAEKSPPDSRITGADSPVIALSSTEATPSITSPSPGIDVAGLDQHDVALAQLVGRAGCHVGCRAAARAASSPTSSACMPRSAAACALLRPSASASAKLANSTVNHSQSATARMKPAGASPWPRERLDPQHGREDAADVDDEHHRVAPLVRAGRAC